MAEVQRLGSIRHPRPDAPMDDVSPFQGIFRSEDSGHANDGPLIERAGSCQVTRLRESVNRAMDRQIG